MKKHSSSAAMTIWNNKKKLLNMYLQNRYYMWYSSKILPSSHSSRKTPGVQYIYVINSRNIKFNSSAWSSLCSYSVPWIAENLSMLLPNSPVFVSPPSRRTSSRLFPFVGFQVLSISVQVDANTSKAKLASFVAHWKPATTLSWSRAGTLHSLGAVTRCWVRCHRDQSTRSYVSRLSQM